MQRLVPASTLVAVIDVQERLAAAMPPARLADLERGVGILLEAARLLGAPVIATEQYPKGLGATVPAVAAKLDALRAPRIEKTDFSACDVAEFARRFADAGPAAVVVVGMEAHVCVYQTVRDLAVRCAVHVPVDAICSRTKANWRIGCALLERAGAIPTSTEVCVFDLLGKAGTDDFKALSKAIK